MGPGHHISPADALALLRETGFSHLAPQLVPLMRPAIHLIATPVELEALPVGASRLGGPADLPEDMEWPRWERGPLALLAQLRLSEVAAHDLPGALPDSGTLWVFYDAVEQPWGMGPEDTEAWRVIFSEDEDGFVRVLPPEGMDEWARFAPHSVEMATVATFPSWETLSEQFPEFQFADDAEEDYYMEWLASITGGEIGEQTRLLGWPEAIQGDVHSEAQYASAGIEWGEQDVPGAPLDWRLLLQVDTMEAPEWMWGDAGRLYFMIRENDLAARRFAGCWMTLQCY
jgi:hypothetical protein